MVLSRLSLLSSLTPFDLTFLRYALPGLIFLPVLLRGGIAVGKSRILRPLALTALGGVPYAAVATAGLLYAPAAHGAVLLPGTLPLFTGFLGWIVLKDGLSAGRIFGVFLIIFGSLFVGWQGLAQTVPGQWIGHLLFLAAALIWSSFTVLLRLWDVSPIRASAIVSVLSTVLYAPPYLYFAGDSLLMAPVSEVALQAVYQGLVVGIGGMVAFITATGVLGAARASVFAGAVPALATLLAVPVLGETVGWIEAAGIAVVSLGIVRASGGRLRTAPA